MDQRYQDKLDDKISEDFWERKGWGSRPSVRAKVALAGIAPRFLLFFSGHPDSIWLSSPYRKTHGQDRRQFLVRG
jgi:hypothetical protein